MSKTNTTAPKKYKTPKAILRHARNLIASRKHWVQEDLKTGDGRFCALGAIEEFSATPEAEALAKRILAEGLAAVVRKHEFDPTEDEVDEAVFSGNDGSFHKTAAGAHRATIRGFDKALA